MSDTIGAFGIIGAVVYFAGAVPYLVLRFVGWIKNAPKPRERLALVVRKTLWLLFFWAVFWCCTGAVMFGAGNVFSDVIPAAESNKLIEWGLNYFLIALPVTLCSGAGIRYMRQPHESSNEQSSRVGD